jgi:hypothetical protein
MNMIKDKISKATITWYLKIENGRATRCVPATESKIFKLKRRNDEWDASGMLLARHFFASTEDTSSAIQDTIL